MCDSFTHSGKRNGRNTFNFMFYDATIQLENNMTDIGDRAPIRLCRPTMSSQNSKTSLQRGCECSSF